MLALAVRGQTRFAYCPSRDHLDGFLRPVPYLGVAPEAERGGLLLSLRVMGLLIPGRWQAAGGQDRVLFSA